MREFLKNLGNLVLLKYLNGSQQTDDKITRKTLPSLNCK